ncbi:replication endonuclease [Roseibium sp. RP-7]
MHRPDPSDFRQSPPHQNFRSKNVDECLRHSVSTAHAIAVSEFSERLLWCRPRSRQQLIDDLPFLGNRHSREKWWRDVNVPDDERGRRLADELNARAYAIRQEAKLLQVKESLSSQEKKRIAQREITLDGIVREREIREEFDALDAEQQDIRLRLPKELRGFLDRMHPARRREREKAIREYVGFDDLKLIEMNPSALAILASARAQQHFRQFPPQDKNGVSIHQEPFHRKRRCEKWWRRRMRKRQRRALHYVEAAIGAVGGPNVPGRPLYVSDYSLESYKSQLRTTEEILEGLRLVCIDDPSVQIPMKELNARKKKADAAKRRLLMDAILARIEGLEWHLCWITITLPGRFVPHATNESFRKEDWDPELGPEEALRAIQKMHHDVMCLLREQKVRPMGWWNAQAQQSGTPHRHLLLACPTREDARAVCDAFWDKFASVEKDSRQAEARQNDPGCRAYVVGDSDPAYAPPKGTNGQEETAASIAKYMARYASRHVDPDLSYGNDDEFLRHAAWASSRRIRTHTWVGFDAGRSPSAMWDTLWAKASRDGENADPENARMRLAIRMMRKVQECIDLIADLRRHQETLEGEDLEHSRDLIKAESSKAAHLAWHAGIAVGLWPDRDLAFEELDWLRTETAALDGEQQGDVRPERFHDLTSDGVRSLCQRLETNLPPMPLRDIRESAYGERRAVTIGVAAPVPRFMMTVKQFRNAESLRRIAQLLDLDAVGKRSERKEILRAFNEAGIRLSKRPDGIVVGFDLSGETILRTDREWIIADVETAEEMLEQWNGRLKTDSPRLDHLSDNPTDPRECASHISGSGQSGEPPPS